MAKGMHLSEKMRNVHLKSKSFVTIAFIVTVGFIVFNLWGLSTQNSDLLVKIEELENNLKISSSKQRDLEDQIGVWKKKADDCTQESRKLASDLRNKESVVNAQAEEASQWGDKVRRAEGEIEKLKASLAVKENELRVREDQDKEKFKSLNEEIESLKNIVAQKDRHIGDVQDRVNALKKEVEGKEVKQEIVIEKKEEKAPPVNSTSGTSSIRPADSAQVLVKPEQEVESNVIPNRYGNGQNEPVAPKPGAAVEESHKEENAVVDNVADVPQKGHEQEVKAAVEDFNIAEPNLINSQGDNLDEPELADQDVKAGGIGVPLNKVPFDANRPEDEEVENERENDDEREG